MQRINNLIYLYSIFYASLTETTQIFVQYLSIILFIIMRMFSCQSHLIC